MDGSLIMYYPIGDIHGRYDLVAPLYEKILEEVERNPDHAFGNTVVFLGDYVDRGPQSKEVLDFLMGLKDTDMINHIFLMGNHEEFFTHCRRNPDDSVTLKNWLYHGGKETVDSFGKTMTEICHGDIDEYIEWIESLPLTAHDYNYVFVHAAIDPYKPLDQQTRKTCLWKFEDYPEAYSNFTKIVVHGHMTNMNGPIIKPAHNRVWMDVGTNFTNRIATVTLPQPYDPDEEIKVIEVQL